MPSDTPTQPKTFKRCIIHIGTEKTGTSAIQDHLAVQREALLKQGVVYPSTLGKYHASHWELAAAILPHAPKQDMGHAFGIVTTEDQAAFREKLAEDLQAEFDASPDAHTLLVSSEHFHSRVSSPQWIALLKDFLSPWAETFTIIVYFRRQDQVALAFQSTRVKSSVAVTNTEIRNWIHASPHYLAYDQVYENWSSVFGKDAMEPRLYAPEHWRSGELVTDFCHALGLPKPTTVSRRINTSLNRKGFQFLQALNAQFKIRPGDRSDAARLALIHEISDAYSGSYVPFSRAELEDYYDGYRDVNERLRAMAFPDLPAPLFDEDFSCYPETCDEAEPSYEDAVEIALHLWRRGWQPPSRWEQFRTSMEEQSDRWRRRLFGR